MPVERHGSLSDISSSLAEAALSTLSVRDSKDDYLTFLKNLDGMDAIPIATVILHRGLA